MERVSVESSNIASIGYDGASLMEIEFKGRKGGPGSVYRYNSVPPEIWHAFLRSPSKGQYLAQHIKGVYPASRVN